MNQYAKFAGFMIFSTIKELNNNKNPHTESLIEYYIDKLLLISIPIENLKETNKHKCCYKT